MKVEKKPLPLIYPNPVVLVTSVDTNNHANIITLTLVGAVCWQPPVIGIGVGEKQHSRTLIDQCGEFAVNIPSASMLRDIEHCGLVSGRDTDKCAETSFTLMPARKIKPPLIKECPVNIECKVKRRIPLGSNILFLGEAVCLHIDDAVLDEKGGVNLAKAAPVMFNLTNTYWSVGAKLADYGFSKQA